MFLVYLLSNLDVLAVSLVFREKPLEKICFSQKELSRNMGLVNMHLIAKILEKSLLPASTQEKSSVDLFSL